MIPTLNQYEKIIGKDKVEQIRKEAEPLKGKHIVHINATSLGGGVAEILNNLVFLMNDVGIDTGWRTILGSHSFFKITKGIHNALQGQKFRFTENRKSIYMDYCKRNSIINHVKDHDIVVVHDPQPLGMIRHYEKKTKWIWRCHIDISTPNRKTMGFLMPFIRKYDGVVISTKKFRIKNLRTPQSIIPPSIDPISTKNKNLTHQKARRLLSKYGIDTDKPIISQISRFDPWKDPFGVLSMYKRIKKEEDCHLVLMGDMATDDPQGPEIYHNVQQVAETIPDVHIITEKNDLLVNALQKESRFVFQNSIKEGFALTVSEAMWKKTPILGTDVGGIPLQIINNKTGIIMHNEDMGVRAGLKLLRDDKFCNRLGEAAHKHVKENFLITRHLNDYIKLFRRILQL